jgi:hypothetical protein
LFYEYDYMKFLNVDKVEKLFLEFATTVRECAGSLTPVVTHAFKVILSSGTPSAWKRAVGTPIPKVSQPKDYQDLGPISVTSILSCLLERFIIIVSKFLLPAMSLTSVS